MRSFGVSQFAKSVIQGAPKDAAAFPALIKHRNDLLHVALTFLDFNVSSIYLFDDLFVAECHLAASVSDAGRHALTELDQAALDCPNSLEFCDDPIPAHIYSHPDVSDVFESSRKFVEPSYHLLNFRDEEAIDATL